MRIVPNTGADRVIDIVRPWLGDGNRVDLASQTLSLFAFGELAGQLAQMAGARLVMPPETVVLDLLGTVADRVGLGKAFEALAVIKYHELRNDRVVIDESHNFRNKRSPRQGSETRYDRLMRRIVREGVKTRVLMLTATPVNNRLADLRNQIAFATEGEDTALADHGVASIDGTTQRAPCRIDSPCHPVSSALNRME